MEIQRKLEIQLNGSHLPLPAESVLHLQVDFRSVEGSVSLVYLVVALSVNIIQDILQLSLCLVPDFDISHEVIRPGGKLRPVGQSEGSVDFRRDIHDILDLVCDLFFGNQNMRVILTEHLHAEQSVQLPGFLFSVNHIHLIDTERQISVGTQTVLINQNGVRAVHRLAGVVIALILLYAGDDEHVLLIVSPVSGSLPESGIAQYGSGNFLITVLLVNASPEIQKSVKQFPSSGKPVGHARRSLVEHKQLLLRSDLLVISLGRFLQKFLKFFQLGFVRKRIDINSLQLISLLVSSPVSTGHGANLKGSIHQFLGIVHMRSAAKIHVIITRVVDGDRFVLRKILDQLCFEFLSPEQLQRLLTGNFLSCPGLAAFDDLMHFILNHLKIIRGKRSGKDKIIIQTVLNLRSDGILHLIFSENLNNRLCQDMGKGMTVNL